MAEAAAQTAAEGNAEKTRQAPPRPMVVPVRSNRGNVTIPIRHENGAREDILLFKGPNLVPAKKWDRATEQPGVKALLAQKIPLIKAEEQDKSLVGRFVLEAGKPVPAAAPLSAMDETEACALIGDIVDHTLLVELQGKENRVAVKRAIAARIEAIKDPEKALLAKEAAAGSTKATISLE